MFYVYILKNYKTNKYYTGFSENLKKRIESHKDKTVNTTKGGQYDLVFYCAFKDKKKALDFEKYLKQGSGFALAKKRLL